MKGLLDIISNDIKRTEEYLYHYPVSENIDIDLGRGITLSLEEGVIYLKIYDMLEGTTSMKPFLQCSAKERILYHKHLPRFLETCREEQNKLIDVESVRATTSRLSQLMQG
jgi:hypothetical protein